MKNKLKDLIQYCVISTCFFPFSSVYRAYYRLCTAFTVSRLKKIPGVNSIYLRRGMASGDIVYGLSDIDLMVILDNDFNNSREKINHTYDRLSRIIPLFGDRAEELGVHTLAEFHKLYQDHDTYKYRFEEGRYTWKLLYGKDVFSSISPASVMQIYSAAVEELKTWWKYLIDLENPNQKIPRFKKKYTWYKVIGESARVYLLLSENQNIYSRPEAINKLKGKIPEEYTQLIRSIKDSRTKLTAKTCIKQNEIWELFYYLTRSSHQHLKSKGLPEEKQIKAKLNFPKLDLTAKQSEYEKNVKLNLQSNNELNRLISHTALIPQVEFDIDILNNADIDGYYLAIVLKKEVSISVLSDLISIVNTVSPISDLKLMAVIDNNTAFSLATLRPKTGIKSLETDPIFFTLVNANELTPIKTELPDSLIKNLEKRNTEIDEIIHQKDIYKINDLDFCRLFWAAARTKLLLSYINSSEFEIPLTGKQIASSLSKVFPEKAAWFDEFYLEYRQEINQMENRTSEFFTEAIATLYSIL